MKNKKSSVAFVIGIIIFSLLILAGYLSFLSNKITAPVSCKIGDRYDIMTGKPCPPTIEETEPATTTTVGN